jgi:hypothetical protein
MKIHSLGDSPWVEQDEPSAMKINYKFKQLYDNQVFMGSSYNSWEGKTMDIWKKKLKLKNTKTGNLELEKRIRINSVKGEEREVNAE